MNNAKPRTPDLGIGYKGTFKDKEGNERAYLSLMIRAEQLSHVEITDGMIRLSVFAQSGVKKNPKAPDFVVKPALSKTKASGTGSANVATASKFPF